MKKMILKRNKNKTSKILKNVKLGNTIKKKKTLSKKKKKKI